MSQQPNYTVFYLVLIWSTFWKGLALWRSAKEGNKYWFLPILVFNTLGIVEIIYLFRFAKHRLTFQEMQGWFKNIAKRFKKSK